MTRAGHVHPLKGVGNHKGVDRVDPYPNELIPCLLERSALIFHSSGATGGLHVQPHQTRENFAARWPTYPTRRSGWNPRLPHNPAFHFQTDWRRTWQNQFFLIIPVFGHDTRRRDSGKTLHPRQNLPTALGDRICCHASGNYCGFRQDILGLAGC